MRLKLLTVSGIAYLLYYIAPIFGIMLTIGIIGAVLAELKKRKREKNGKMFEWV